MMYNEFTALAKRPITEDKYHEIVEPVYNYHPACIDKQATALLYDIGGLQLFRDMTATAERVRELEAESGRLNERLNEIIQELEAMAPARLAATNKRGTE